MYYSPLVQYNYSIYHTETATELSWLHSKWLTPNKYLIITNYPSSALTWIPAQITPRPPKPVREYVDSSTAPHEGRKLN